VAVAVVLAVLGGGAAIAGAVVPPAGTPNLAAMTLGPADFAPGGLSLGGYATPVKGAVAQYVRVMEGVTTTGGVKLTEAGSDIFLLGKASSAAGVFKQTRALLRSRADVAALIQKGAGSKAHIVAKDVTLGQVHGLGVGQQSLLGTFTVRVGGKAIHASLSLVRVDKILGDLTLAASGRLPRSAADALTRTMAAHITTVLAGVGSTGPSGPTGATGATGTTG
jgi:hypothetical protein